MSLELMPAQKQFIWSEKPYPAICGGFGSGKTKAATVRLLKLMLSEPGINTLLGMPTYDLLRLRAIPGVEEDLQQLGIGYNLNKSEWAIYIHGFGSIYFRSYDNPQRWIAFEVSHTILDELDTLKKDKAEIVWRKAMERTRQVAKRRNTIGCVTTPDQGIGGFTYDRWVKNATDDYEIIKASTYSNPYLPPDYAESIRAQYDPVMADAYLNGEFVSLNQNKVYHQFDRRKHHTDRTIKHGERLHVGIDFNIGGCCAVVCVIDGAKPIAVDEFVAHDTQDFCTRLAKYDGNKIIVYPDASGKAGRTNAAVSDLDIIEQNGFRVDAPRANPAIRDRVNSVNGLLAHGNFGINCNACPELTDALEVQGYVKGEPEKFDSHPAVDDWNDSLGYFIHRKFPISRPVVSGLRGVA